MTGPLASQGDAAVLEVACELDVATAPELLRAALDTLDAYDEVQLDLRRVGFIDCSGMRALQAIEREAARRRRRLTVSTSPAIDRLRDLLQQAQERAAAPAGS